MGATDCDFPPFIIPYEARYQTISAFINHPSRCHLLHECSIPPLFLCLAYLFYIYHFLVWKDLVLTIPRWSARNRRANRFVPLLSYVRTCYCHRLHLGFQDFFAAFTILPLLYLWHTRLCASSLITSPFRAFNYLGLHIHCFVTVMYEHFDHCLSFHPGTFKVPLVSSRCFDCFILAT